MRWKSPRDESQIKLFDDKRIYYDKKNLSYEYYVEDVKYSNAYDFFEAVSKSYVNGIEVIIVKIEESVVNGVNLIKLKKK